MHSLSGTNDWVAGTDNYAHSKLSNFRVLSPVRVTCDVDGTYVDNDKTVTCRSKLDMTLSGNTISATSTGISRSFKWKPGVAPYEDSSNVCVPGRISRDTLKRKW